MMSTGKLISWGTFSFFSRSDAPSLDQDFSSLDLVIEIIFITVSVVP